MGLVGDVELVGSGDVKWWVGSGGDVELVGSGDVVVMWSWWGQVISWWVGSGGDVIGGRW